MSERFIPVHPSPGDLVFLIDAMIDVAGSYSRGILHRFGVQLGEKYAMRIKVEGLVKEEPLRAIMGTLMVSGWFKDFSHAVQDDAVVIRLLHPFELDSREGECGFMRGFLSGIGNVFGGLPKFYSEEKDGEWSLFVGKKEDET